MDAWFREFHGLFLNFFGRATHSETYMVVALCLLFGALALSRVSTSLGAMGAFYTTGMVVMVIGVGLIGAVMAALPQLGLNEWWMPVAAMVAAVLVLVVPMTMLLQKGGYIAALIAWVVTLLVVAVILTLEPMGMRLVEKGEGKARQIEKRRIETEHYR